MLQRKVFGIGLARTGTTSLHEAMGLLGINSAPTSVALLDDPKHPILHEYDAFFDNPIPFLYRDLDQAWPGSLFIASTRDCDDWLRSMKWLFDQGLARLDPAERQVGDRVHQVLYGSTTFDRERLSAVWRDHHEGVTEWFGDRDDLLWVDLGRGEGWAPICEFLGVAQPNIAFPHRNAARRPSLKERFGRLLSGSRQL